jgi:peptidoglycan/LPS O-acetylase OafA/YrhL
MKTGFRQDINGLRAWAVVAVILFHFGVPGFSGGFVGVDIFFVISGFLMTGIIYKGLTEDSFSILDFYLARAKRIIPALLALCCVLLILGWQFLPAIEYEQLGKHVFGAATFLSNIIFWQEAGYFDSASHDKWLLHTWSLSVEWQFYIILPLVLLAIWKVSPKKKTLIAIYILAIFASLALSTFAVNWKPSAAFYLLPTRAWEMLAGGLVFLLQQQFTKNSTQLKIYELLGFSFIVASIAVFNSQTLWPGWKALLPTIGTCLVIIGNQGHSILSTTKLHTAFGKWSYSLYLWHWPLVVALVFIGEASNPKWITLGLICTVLLGWISYRLIESYSAKRLSALTTPNLIKVTFVSIAIISFSGLLLKMLNGQSGRVDPVAESISQEKNNMHPRRMECTGSKENTSPECHYGGNDITAMIIGDSHAAAIIGALEASLPKESAGFIGWTYNSCPTLLNVERKGRAHCREFNTNAFARSQRLPEGVPIIILNRYTDYILGASEFPPRQKQDFLIFPSQNGSYNEKYKREMAKTLCKYTKNNPVYMLKPIPEMGKNVPFQMARDYLLGNDTSITISKKEYLLRHKVALQAQNYAVKKCNITILDPLEYLCDESQCYSSIKGQPIYYDDDHLSQRGALLLAPLFKDILSHSHNTSVNNEYAE